MVEPGSKVSVRARLRNDPAHEARLVVRVVGQEVDQGQDFTRLGVQNDDTTALALWIDHGLTQIAVPDTEFLSQWPDQCPGPPGGGC